MASAQELSDFLSSIEQRAFKQAVYAVRDDDAGLDIVQDAMIKLAEKYGDKPVAELPLLFTRILQNRIHDWFRRQKVRNACSAIPSEMIGNAERAWINQSNIFSATVGQNNSFFPYYTLQATVNEFYGDYRVRPEAVVSVEFFLSVTNTGKMNPLIGANRYTKRVALKDNTPEAQYWANSKRLRKSSSSTKNNSISTPAIYQNL